MHAFDYDDPSLNHPEVYCFYSVNLFEKKENKTIEAGNGSRDYLTFQWITLKNDKIDKIKIEWDPREARSMLVLYLLSHPP